jgi:hypothetical protein
MRCRSGTVPNDSVWYGPGSAERHFAPHRVRDKIQRGPLSSPGNNLVTRLLSARDV